ncbi:MAG: hypothetical protein QXS12_03145 [Candidatus Caldarchaeum sp.]
MMLVAGLAVDLKRELLRLLDEDEEFRYAVAGRIGILEILKHLDRLEEGQNKLWEEVRSLREGQNKLWEEVRSLREGQEKLWENQNRLWESNNRLWEEVRSLREGQEKLWQGQEKLWEGQKRLEESMARLQDAVALLARTQGELAKQVGALSETIGFGLEDIAKVVVPGWLQRHEGIVMAEEFTRKWITVDGEEIEVNLYGEGEKDGRKLVIIGEAKSRIYKREVEAFGAWAEKIAATIGQETYKFMFGYLIHPSAEEEGRKRKIKLIASYMR